MKRQSAPMYDLFKLIVLLILLALLILIFLRPPSASFPSMLLPGAASSGNMQATEQAAAAISTSVSATQNARAAITEPTLTATLKPTSAPTPTEPASQPTATPDATASTSEQTSDLEACAALPSRLTIGTNVRVMTNLHFRSSPGMDAGLIRTHYSGTVMEVIGGPECIPYQGGAYLWWELRHPDGSSGWSAEGSISSSAYFIEPVD